MVIESIMNPLKAEKKPWDMFFIGFVYSTIAVFLSLWIFKTQASLVMVFLTVMAAIPIVYDTMKLEEGKDLKIMNERALLKEHNKALLFLMFLFLGITISATLWYVILPSSYVSYLFQEQTQTITSINQQISGKVVQFDLFSKILFNNIKVLAFSVLFSFIYSAGAIFILTWNASVIGAAIGNFIRSRMSDYVATVGLTKLGAYFQIVSLGLLRYAIHGIPEILAYFYGGLAGGIISIAIIRHHFTSKKFSNIIIDSSELLIISIGFLLIAAILEVYVTPLLF